MFRRLAGYRVRTETEQARRKKRAVGRVLETLFLLEAFLSIIFVLFLFYPPSMLSDQLPGLGIGWRPALLCSCVNATSKQYILKYLVPESVCRFLTWFFFSIYLFFQTLFPFPFLFFVAV